MKRVNVRRAGALATLFAVMLLAPALAQAAKVTETAAGVSVPDSVDNGGVFSVGSATQTFKLKGSKVKGKQIVDVNVILNASVAPGSDSLDNLEVTLIGPKGDQAELTQFGNLGTRQWVDLKFDDQSLLRGCDPAEVSSSRCNYVQNGTLTGSVHAVVNPVFRGGNPKGTWRLLFRDTSIAPPADPPAAVGTSTLEVKTGKKFAKEGQ